MSSYSRIAFYILLAVSFLSAPLITTYDSAWYHKYLSILNGNLPWSEWDYVRGITLPLLLKVTHFLFGYTSQGLLISLCSSFLLSCYFGLSQSRSLTEKIFFGIFFALNPIIFGYFHVFLPEPVGIFGGLLLYYILSKYSLNLKVLCIVGIVLIFIHQTKESITLFTLPATITTIYLSSSHKRIFVKYLSVLIVFFLLGNFLIKKTLNHLSPPQPSAASKILVNGLAYGVARTTLFRDIPFRADAIATQVQDNTNILESLPHCASDINPHLKISLIDQTQMLCEDPSKLGRALKISTNFFILSPGKFTVSLIKNTLEPLRIIPNRYNEVEIIGYYLYKRAKQNTIPVDNEEFQKYVDPYTVTSPRPVGALASLTYKVFGSIYLGAYPFICALGLIFAIIPLLKRRLDTLSSFGLAAIPCLAFSAFVGMINDRYFLVTYPFLVLIIGRQLGHLRLKPLWSNLRKRS